MGNDHNKEKRIAGAHQQQSAVVPTREALTQVQLATLHQIIQVLQPFLMCPKPFFQLEEDFTPRKIEGGVAASAAVTFNNVCLCIDSILEDKSRWDTSAHDQIYDAVTSAYKAQAEYLTAQAAALRVAARPAVQFHPTIANDGEQFICFYGDINRTGYAIIGLGKTPADAMQAFDDAFAKTSQEQIIMAAEAVAENLEKTKPKRKNKNEPPPLDS